MGMYDEYAGVQIKVGDACMEQYEIGDNVSIPDGIYCGYEGLIVILNGKLIAKFAYMFTKWGDIIDPEHILD